MPPWTLWVPLSLVVWLTGCATYHAKPLPQSPDLAEKPTLAVSVKNLAVPDFKPHPFTAKNGLDKTEVVTLAILNNPDLKAKRKQAGIAAAQLLQAGLLPNPQVSANFMHPTGGPPPLFNGYSVGLMQDLSALITRSSKRVGAQAHKTKVNLNILWQEWQVAEQARQLFIQARSQARLEKVLRTRQELNAHHYRRDQAALRQGNLTLSTTSADLVGLVNANTQLRQLQLTRNQTRHKLNTLLGLQPGVKLDLSPSPRPEPFFKTQFNAAIAALPKRRPDLLALKAGYESQQAAVRQAILGQFPQLSVGPTKASDTSHVHTIGVGVSLPLPLFDRNQGQIALARATRAQLRAAYQARLDQAVNKAHKLWCKVAIMRRQLDQLKERLPELEQTTDAAQRAFKRGNMSAGTYINLRSSYLDKRIEMIRLAASMAQTRASLETLLGMTVDMSAAKPAGSGS